MHSPELNSLEKIVEAVSLVTSAVHAYWRSVVYNHISTHMNSDVTMELDKLEEYH